MRKRSVVNMLLSALLLTAMGCAHNEVVKTDEAVTQATPQKTADAKIDAQPQQIAPADAKTNPSSDKAAADAAKNPAALQAGLAAIYFAFDSNELTNESRTTLQSNFKNLNGKSSILIEGNCDERGSSEYNLALGEKRAKAAQSYLVTLGYPADKIATISYGKERPADQGHDEAAWAKNRRDEFKIVK